VTRTLPTASPRLSAQAAGILLVLVSACAFGSGALLVQPLYDGGMEPLVVLFWRFTTAAGLSWAWLALSSRTRASARRLTRRRVAVLLFLGALYVGNSYSYVAALQVVPIALVSIISYLYPAIVAVMSLRLVRRLEGRRAWIALALSIVGVALAVGGIPEGGLPPLWGLALAFANPVIYAAWIVFQARVGGERPTTAGRERPTTAGGAPPGPPADTGAPDAAASLPPVDAEAVTRGPDPAAAAALMTTSTAAMYAVLTLATGGSLSPAVVPVDLWPPILAFGAVATALAIQAFYAGVRRVGAARASIISTVEPVYTISLAVILFGETLTPIQVAGGLLVLFAVLLAESGRREPEPFAEPVATSAVRAD
jgi:drug/metabolite transporter (DMT)-like permease